MIPIKRRERILAKLDEQSVVKVGNLAEELEVSESTIRRDLEDLKQEGLIVRDYGGAIKVDEHSTAFEPPSDLKKTTQHKEKQKIGKAASSLVKNGETVLLDAGSTTLEVARALKSGLSLTVVTNDLKIALEITNKNAMDLIVLGGKHRPGVYTLQGAIAERSLKEFTVNRTFLGADAIDEEVISNVNTEEIRLKKLMVARGNKVSVVADHTKFDRRVFATVCEVKKIDSLITDTQPPERMMEKFQEEEIEVITTT